MDNGRSNQGRPSVAGGANGRCEKEGSTDVVPWSSNLKYDGLDEIQGDRERGDWQLRCFTFDLISSPPALQFQPESVVNAATNPMPNFL